MVLEVNLWKYGNFPQSLDTQGLLIPNLACICPPEIPETYTLMYSYLFTSLAVSHWGKMITADSVTYLFTFQSGVCPLTLILRCT